MERALLWFTCAALHDPVRPVLRKPAEIGWEGKFRQVDLVIERPLRGDELLSRMKGWFTVDVKQVQDVASRYGRLILLDERHLVIETAGEEDMTGLEKELTDLFGREVSLERLPKKRLA